MNTIFIRCSSIMSVWLSQKNYFQCPVLESNPRTRKNMTATLSSRLSMQMVDVKNVTLKLKFRLYVLKKNIFYYMTATI